MKNLRTLKELEISEIIEILKDAKEFKNGMVYKLSDKVIANLFFEPSTRTQNSFNMAALKLDMKVINFNANMSSLQKGETFYDTVKTFEALGVDAMVIRHSQDRYYDELKNIKVPIINAGDGVVSHPSQTLLDLFTIYEEFGKFEDLNVMIVGDIKHSRVAHENIDIMKRLGMKCFVSGALEFKEDGFDWDDFDEGLKKADIVMMLRIQHERHSERLQMSISEYLEKYGLTLYRVNQMKPNAIIMHPAPFNRGVEIEGAVAECEKSRIFKQIENGVYVRQAIIKRSFS